MGQFDSREAEPRYGWVVVGVAIVCLGIANGSVNAISVFLIPLATDLGWSRGDTAFGYMAATICVGLGGVVTGYISDRYSTRPVVLTGTVVLGVALLLLGRQQSLWQFYLLYCLMGGGGIAAMHAPLLANVGNWFARNKGFALGVTQGGRAIGNGLIPLLAGILITTSGWRYSYTVLGVIVLVVITPLVLLVRQPPALSEPAAGAKAADGPAAPNAAAAAPGSGAPILGGGAVIAWVGSASVFCCVCMSVPLVHVVALAQDRGLDPHSAAGVLTVIMLTGVVGSVAFGKAADLIGEVQAYMLASACQTAMVYWFTQVTGVTGFYVLGLLFGLGYSGVMSCLIVCVRGLAPLRNRGLSLGAVTMFAWFGMGLGGFQGGYFFDLTGNYNLSFAIAAFAGVINLVILSTLLVHLTRRRRAGQAAPAPA